MKHLNCLPILLFLSYCTPQYRVKVIERNLVEIYSGDNKLYYKGNIQKSSNEKGWVRHGSGTLFNLTDGSILDEGIWENDCFKSGERITYDGTFIGTFNCSYVSTGTFTAQDGGGGSYENGKKVGRWKDGKNIYTYKNGIKDGYAEIYHHTGELYYKGECKYYYAVCQEPCRPHGNGTVFWQTGGVNCKGRWFEGYLHGSGECYSEDGKLIFKGEWFNGQPVKK